jgi:hypothetical protein
MQEGVGRHISAMEWMEGASGDSDLLLFSKLGSACVATVPQAIEDPDVDPVPFEQVVTHDFSMLTNWAGQTPFAPCAGKLRYLVGSSLNPTLQGSSLCPTQQRPLSCQAARSLSSKTLAQDQN